MAGTHPCQRPADPLAFSPSRRASTILKGLQLAGEKDTSLTRSAHQPSAPFRGVVLACAATVCFLATLALAGWAAGNEILITILPGHASLKPNTAIGFLLLGLGLAAARGPSATARSARSLAAVLALTLGVLTLLEFALHLDLHIDQLLFVDTVSSRFPGRMAQITAGNMCLAAIALLTLAGGPRTARLSQFCSAVVAASSWTAVTGYLYGVPTLYGAAGPTAMALHTGVAFLVLALGLLLASSHSALAHLLLARERGSWVGRRVLPFVLILPFLLGWLYLRPALNLHDPAFGVALYAVTLVGIGIAMVWVTANFLDRQQLQLAEFARVREQTAAIISQSEQELRLITDHLPALLSYIDRDGRFLRVNRTYETWLGRAADTIIGKTVREVLGEAYWNETREAREDVALGKTVDFEICYPTVQGGRQTQVTYAPDIDEVGTFQGMACLVLDMHDRHQTEAALRQSEKLAVVGRLASSIAHEINNPLEAVTNLLYLAEQDPRAEGELGQYLQQAQSELARVTHIVTQTLRFHRQATHPVPCKVSTLATQVLVLYEGRLAQSNVAVELRFRDADDLLCRDGEIRQTMANLIGNAIDAMKEGGRLLIRTRMATDPRTGRHGVQAIVADTGHGIGAAVQARLFTPFHTTKGATGSGLGLWISKEIVERHGGRLTLRSRTEPGCSGTVFRLFLPGADPNLNAQENQVGAATL